MIRRAWDEATGADMPMQQGDVMTAMVPSAKPRPPGLSGSVVASAEASATKITTLGATPVTPSASVTRYRRDTSPTHASPLSPTIAGMPLKELRVPSSKRRYWR